MRRSCSQPLFACQHDSIIKHHTMLHKQCAQRMCCCSFYASCSFKRGSLLVNFVIPEWWCDDNKTAAIYYTVPPQLQPHRWFSIGIYSKVATFFSKRAWVYVLDSCPTEDSAERLDWQAGWVDYPSGTEAVLWTTDWHKILVRRVRSAEARQILHEAHLRRQKARRDARQLRKAGPGRELPGAE